MIHHHHPISTPLMIAQHQPPAAVVPATTAIAPFILLTTSAPMPPGVPSAALMGYKTLELPQAYVSGTMLIAPNQDPRLIHQQHQPAVAIKHEAPVLQQHSPVHASAVPALKVPVPVPFAATPNKVVLASTLPPQRRPLPTSLSPSKAAKVGFTRTGNSAWKEVESRSKLPTNSSVSVKVGSKPKIQRRARSAGREELVFLKYIGDDSSVPRVRVWLNSRNMSFYDCSCAKRKPVQDLSKIKKHVESHSIKEHQCSVCGRIFENYRQLNGHLKVHC